MAWIKDAAGDIDFYQMFLNQNHLLYMKDSSSFLKFVDPPVWPCFVYLQGGGGYTRMYALECQLYMPFRISYTISLSFLVLSFATNRHII